MEKTIFIRKESGKERQDVRRIFTKADLPELPSKDEKVKAIEIVGEKLVLDCAEGVEKAKFGDVIAWGKSDKTKSGWNVYAVGEGALVEKDGKFFTKATVYKAALITDELPSFLEGADVTHNDDGSWSLKTSWGEVISRKPGEAYWVLYGLKDDGSIDANILTKGEVGYDDYFVCDEEGNIQGKLCELDG